MHRVLTFNLVDNSLSFLNLPFAIFTHRSLNLGHFRYNKLFVIGNSLLLSFIKGIDYLRTKPFNIQSVVCIKKLKHNKHSLHNTLVFKILEYEKKKIKKHIIAII